MKLLLAGHSVEDHIIYKNSINVKPGGIFYSALAAVNYKQPEDEIYLCTMVEEKNYELFSFIYEKAEKDFIQYSEAIPKVHLTIYDDKEREERYENITAKLSVPFNDLEQFNGILINMITGFDIDLEQLREIRKNFGGIIYMDVHTFSRGLDPNMQRYFRRIENFNEWASCVDILQSNEPELQTLTDKENEFDIAEELLSYGIKFVIVTKGDRGARIYYNNKNEINSIYVSSQRYEINNKVGCGDVFGSVFFYAYLKEGDMNSALMQANTAAGLTVYYKDFNSYKNLLTDVFKRLS